MPMRQAEGCFSAGRRRELQVRHLEDEEVHREVLVLQQEADAALFSWMSRDLIDMASCCRLQCRCFLVSCAASGARRLVFQLTAAVRPYLLHLHHLHHLLHRRYCSSFDSAVEAPASVALGCQVLEGRRQLGQVGRLISCRGLARIDR
jgi:hypothetical protein